MALADVDQTGVAAALNMSVSTLSRKLRGEAYYLSWEERWKIAELCKLDGWFTADFSRIAEVAEDSRLAIQREIAAIRERDEARRARSRATTRPRKRANP